MVAEASESPAEPSGVNRLDGWMARNPRVVAGIWTVFALTSGITAVFTDEEPIKAFKIAFALAWGLLALREFRRARAQGS